MYKFAINFAIILFGLILSGCEDEPKDNCLQKNQSKQVQELANNLYSLPPEPEPEKPIIEFIPKEPPIITPVEFPDPKPLFRQEATLHLRGKRFDNSRRRKDLIEKRRSALQYRLWDEDYRQWDKPLDEDKSTLPVDRSRFLTADMRINAVLEDQINSQIPGRVIAIVDRDILSPNGHYILIPAYTKIICGYDGLDQTGETRLAVSCTRAIRPDGTSIILTNSISSDQMGRTGLIGEVDNRVFERYGAAFIVSALSAMSQVGVSQSQNQGVHNAATSLSNNLGQVTAEVIKKNIDLRPIITIDAGSRIQIIPQTDIVLRKPIAELR